MNPMPPAHFTGATYGDLPRIHHSFRERAQRFADRLLGWLIIAAALAFLIIPVALAIRAVPMFMKGL